MKNISLLLFITLISYIYSHARLQNFQAWNPNYSKTNPCGGGATPTIKAGSLVAGNTQNFVWQIIAGDGTGAVTASIDTAGGTNFNTPLPLTGATPTTTGVFTFTATIPALTCTGASTDANTKLCTIQLKSDSGWYSCTSLEILPAGSIVVPVTPTQCVYPSTLKFCSMVNNQNVLIPAIGQTVNQYDDTIKNTFYATLNNPAVFSNPNGTGCEFYYKKLYCGFNFPPCSAPTTGGCNQACSKTSDICQVTTLHQNLFDCKSTYTNNKTDSTGSCNALYVASSSSIKLSYLMFGLILIINLIF
jgi:hypothetical protein